MLKDGNRWLICELQAVIMFTQNYHTIVYAIQQVEIFVGKLAHISDRSDNQSEQHANES